MAFCVNCGKEIANGAAFCPNCGTANQGSTVIYVKPKVPGRGLGISSMVLGIIAMVYAFSVASVIPEMIKDLTRIGFGVDSSSSVVMPIIMLSSMSVLSLCFAPAAIKRGYKNGISYSGLILGLVSLCLYLYTFISIAKYLYNILPPPSARWGFFIKRATRRAVHHSDKMVLNGPFLA